MAGWTASKPGAWRACPSRSDAGASPLFPPAQPDADAAQAALLHLVRRDPRTLGVPRTRWRLADLLGRCPWLRLKSRSGLWRLLRRLRIHYKRARAHIHSPDPAYEAKLTQVAQVRHRAHASAGREVLLYEDELTLYRQPTLGAAYEQAGHAQPLAEQAPAKNTTTRVVGTLDPLTGRVISACQARLDVPHLVAFYQQVRAAYPQAERIWLVQDNWPVHVHPDLLVALEPQEGHWPRHTPKNWPTEPSVRARRAFGALRLPIQLLFLPTYASWTNPAEKLWRRTKQEAAHLHRLAHDLPAFRHLIADFLAQFVHGSPDLLRYCGLLVPN